MYTTTPIFVTIRMVLFRFRRAAALALANAIVTCTVIRISRPIAPVVAQRGDDFILKGSDGFIICFYIMITAVTPVDCIASCFGAGRRFTGLSGSQTGMTGEVHFPIAFTALIAFFSSSAGCRALATGVAQRGNDFILKGGDGFVICFYIMIAAIAPVDCIASCFGAGRRFSGLGGSQAGMTGEVHFPIAFAALFAFFPSSAGCRALAAGMFGFIQPHVAAGAGVVVDPLVHINGPIAFPVVPQRSACDRFSSGRVFAFGVREDHAAALTITNVILIPTYFSACRLLCGGIVQVMAQGIAVFISAHFAFGLFGTGSRATGVGF